MIFNEMYGGQRQGGIATASGQPLTFLIEGGGGSSFGDADGWDDYRSFRYYGKGQVGDMQSVRGNAVIRDHASLGREIHVIEEVRLGRHV